MRPLTDHIIEQKHELLDEAETLKIKKQVEKDKLQKIEQQEKRMYCKKPQRRCKSKIKPGKRITKLAIDYIT